MKKIAVILSGCGVFDGSEIQESVITLLNITKHGAVYECFAPDIDQHHVINHLTGEEKNQTRNVMEESARISRGKIHSLKELNVKQFDAVVVPGGFGTAKNLSDFAFAGSSLHVNPELASIIQQFKAEKKPIGLICISPAMTGKLFDHGTLCTIGNDADTAYKIEETGAVHIPCTVDDIVVDENSLLVTTPAYMLAEDIGQVDKGIGKMVGKLIELCG